MKIFLYCVIWSASICQAIFAQISNTLSLVPTDNIAGAHSPYQGDNFFRIATNTAAFEEYGFNLMLAKANEVGEKWHLDIPQPLTIRDVSFWLKATPKGIAGCIGTREGRYNWGFKGNDLEDFSDQKYWPRSFRYHDEESARLTKIKSLITGKEAEKIARDALHQLGLTEKDFHLSEKLDVHQYKFEETNGVIYPLPCFNVRWRMEGPKQYAAENMEYNPIVMDVSGITKRVVKYFTVEWSASNPKLRRVPIATNYFQMLNLPTNYLDTLPALRRKMLGLPLITNAPTAVTNLAK